MKNNGLFPLLFRQFAKQSCCNLSNTVQRGKDWSVATHARLSTQYCEISLTRCISFVKVTLNALFSCSSQDSQQSCFSLFLGKTHPHRLIFTYMLMRLENLLLTHVQYSTMQSDLLESNREMSNLQSVTITFNNIMLRYCFSHINPMLLDSQMSRQWILL